MDRTSSACGISNISPSFLWRLSDFLYFDIYHLPNKQLSYRKYGIPQPVLAGHFQRKFWIADSNIKF